MGRRTRHQEAPGQYGSPPGPLHRMVTRYGWGRVGLTFPDAAACRRLIHSLCWRGGLSLGHRDGIRFAPSQIHLLSWHHHGGVAPELRAAARDRPHWQAPLSTRHVRLRAPLLDYALTDHQGSQKLYNVTFDLSSDLSAIDMMSQCHVCKNYVSSSPFPRKSRPRFPPQCLPSVNTRRIET